MSGFWQGKRILLCVCGGVSAYKSLEMIRIFKRSGAEVRVAATSAALEFVTRLSLETLSGQAVFAEFFAPDEGWAMNHIRLAREADLVLVLPTTADLMARVASGRAEDLVSALLLARRGPVLMAPAMNWAMWEHPATQRNVAQLQQDGVSFVLPVSGPLACGEEGAGRLANLEVILETARRLLSPRFLAGERILVTAGGTREELDPVRYLSNHASGKMGWEVAAAAMRAGAQVLFLHGPMPGLEPPLGVEAIATDSAQAMYDAAVAHWPRCRLAILAAAVADFRPARRQEEKIKKTGLAQGLGLELLPTPDILRELVATRQPLQKVVGFAAETGDLAVKGWEKIQRKGCDLLVGNDVSLPGSGFGVDTNRMTLFHPNGHQEQWPILAKEEVAEKLLRVAASLLPDL